MRVRLSLGSWLRGEEASFPGPSPVSGPGPRPEPDPLSDPDLLPAVVGDRLWRRSLTGMRFRPIAGRSWSGVRHGLLAPRSWSGVGHGWVERRLLLSTRRQRGVRMCPHDERGSGSLLAVAASLALIGFAAVAVWVIAWFGCLHRADQVADLASSAGAEAFAAGGDPCGVAARVADLNKARLTSCQSGGVPGNFVVKAEVAVPLHPRMPGAPEEVRSRAAAGVVG